MNETLANLIKEAMGFALSNGTMMIEYGDSANRLQWFTAIVPIIMAVIAACAYNYKQTNCDALCCGGFCELHYDETTEKDDDPHRDRDHRDRDRSESEPRRVRTLYNGVTNREVMNRKRARRMSLPPSRTRVSESHKSDFYRSGSRMSDLPVILSVDERYDLRESVDERYDLRASENLQFSNSPIEYSRDDYYHNESYETYDDV